MVMTWEEVSPAAPQTRLLELTSWTGLLFGGARTATSWPWSTPATLIFCIIEWALAEAASARAESAKEDFMVFELVIETCQRFEKRMV